MLTMLFILLFLFASVQSLTCSSNQFYVKILKQCTSYGNEESFKIRTSSTVYFSSPTYGNNQLYIHEVCLPLSVNQFNLILYDNYGDSWSSGAYVEIRDSNNRLLVKAVMTNRSEQQFTFTRTPISESCTGPHVTLIKKTTMAAERESFQIKYSSGLAYTSPPFTNNNLTSVSICLPSSYNSVYTLVMRDSSNGTWSGGSWLEIRSIQDSVILKAIMTQNKEESISFLIFTAMEKGSTWFYRTTYVSDWFGSSNTNDWNTVSFNSSIETSGTMYYRSSFSGYDDSVIELLFRYQYGIVVYLNTWEIFRDHMPEGPISINTLSSGSYEACGYHGIRIPSWSSYDSTNILAVELHYPSNETRNTIEFDGVVTFSAVISETVCSIYAYSLTASSDDITGSSNSIDWNIDTFTRIPKSITPRSFILTISDVIPLVTSLRMFPASTEPIPFVVEARTQEDSLWELVSFTPSFVYEGWNTLPVQMKDARYRQYRITIPTNTEIRLKELQLMSCYGYETFDYSFNEYRFYLNHPVVNIIPYLSLTHCHITPSLPPGLSISSSCVISGTPTELSQSRVYVISAIEDAHNKLSFLTIEVASCSNLFSIRVRSDGYPEDNSWHLYSGRGTSNRIQSCTNYPVSNGFYYFDFCLTPGLYTFQARDSYGDGWSVRSGYTLLFEDEQMELEMMELPSGNSYVTTVFSTVVPFHSEYSEWKVYRGNENVPFDWNSIIMDDSDWFTCTPSTIPPSSSITTYIRRTFGIPNIYDYRVMNIRMRYEGGVAVFFNSHLVARFNLNDEFDSHTEATMRHERSTYSKFHIILSMVEPQTRSNVIAFEIHRVEGNSNSTEIVFDATGVYGVETCSTVIDSYSQVTSSSLVSGSLADIMNLNPHTGGQLSSLSHTYIEWTVENLEGSKWNSFNILTGTTVNVFSMSVNGYQYDESLSLYTSSSSIIFISRTKPQITIARSLLGFRKYRWEYSIVSSSLTLDSLHLAYCIPSSSYCAGIGEFPAVLNGEVSVARCPYGFTGYSYRQCSGGYLSSIQLDKCIRLPQKVTVASGEAYRFAIPIEGNNLTYSITSGDLPSGLTFDDKNGIISGTPKESGISCSIVFDVMDSDRHESFTLELTILTRVTSLKYAKSKTTLIKGRSYSLVPVMKGDQVLFSIISGELPKGLVLIAETGEISGKPIETSNSVTVTIEARNELGAMSTTVELTVRLLSGGVIFWIVLVVIGVVSLIVIAVLYVVLKLRSKSLRPRLPLPKPTSLPVPKGDESQQSIEMKEIVPVVSSSEI